MVPVRIALHLLFSLVVLAPSANGVTLRECAQHFAHLISRDHWRGTDDIRLTERQRQVLSEWASDHWLGGHPHLLEDQAILAFSKLPRGIREELFTRNGIALRRRQILNRWEALGLSPRHPVLDTLYRTYERGQKGNYDQMEALVHRTITAPTAEQAATEQALRSRLLIGDIVATLRSKAPFKIRVEGEEVVFPDGQRNKLVKRLKDGTLLVEFDNNQMLRTQDYFNGKIFLEYVKEKNGDGVGFDGDVTPDGRFWILDGHHRTAAYASRHDGKVLGRVYPSQNGEYYTSSHMAVMVFYKGYWDFSHWQKMPLEQLEKERAALKANPSTYLKDEYYRIFPGRRSTSP